MNEYTSGVALSPFVVSFGRDVKPLVPCQVLGRRGEYSPKRAWAQPGPQVKSPETNSKVTPR
ncbi:hypothetical protein EVA_20644 [gut metagenome]|uniref:Uncharacterized protein n=1 Tax=gut metagenome TaxID=749906 RepID=J9F9X7_9ZZZZ